MEMMEVPRWQLCSIDALRADIEDPLRSIDPTLAADVAAQASALAFAAWEKGDGHALDRAERVLHFLNSRHHFAVPLSHMASIVGTALARGRLTSGFRAYTGPTTVDAEQMKAALLWRVERADREDHPLLEEISEAHGLEGLIVFAKNWMTSTQGFLTQLIALAQRCALDTRLVVLRNILDEMSGPTHEHLRARFVAKLGLEYDPARGLSTYEPGLREDPLLVTSSFSLVNFRACVTALPNPAYALGSFYTIEASFLRVCRILLGALRRRDGFDEDALEIFRVHAELDAEHASEWLNILERQPLTPRDRACVLQGAAAQMHIRHLWFQDMRALWEGIRD